MSIRDRPEMTTPRGPAVSCPLGKRQCSGPQVKKLMWISEPRHSLYRGLLQLGILELLFPPPRHTHLIFFHWEFFGIFAIGSGGLLCLLFCF